MRRNVLLSPHQLPLHSKDERLRLNDELKGEYYSVCVYYLTVVEREKVA